MTERLIVILDVGKTLAKLSLWTAAGEQLAKRTRTNERREQNGCLVLDAEGIEHWLGEVLAEFAGMGDIGAIYPVGHGAAVAIIRDGALAAAPLDYEQPLPPDFLSSYRSECDPFPDTGSPPLPDGLNLGAQLFWLRQRQPELFERATLLPWPQYWAWRLCGVAASEFTSLGCHTDLWRPHERRFSDLAIRHGWAGAFAPLRSAREVLGNLSPEWTARTGLAHDVAIYCGIHDSNAALVAARGFTPFETSEATVLSTGTWFVAMRTPAQTPSSDQSDTLALPAGRDCLLNVDVDGNPVPSARFMGGREIEILTGADARTIDIRPDQPALLQAAPRLVSERTFITPSFARGCGPFPQQPGEWIPCHPAAPIGRRAVAALYTALVADTALSLIGARERLLIEGRFAEGDLFVRALKTLRPDMAVFVSHAENDVSFGALRLINPALRPSAELIEAAPLECDLLAYRADWLRTICTAGETAS